MATKKKKRVGATKKTTPKKSKGKSSVTFGMFFTALATAIAVGAIVKKLNLTFKGAPYVINGGQVVVGLLLAFKSKNAIVNGVGLGMGISGGTGLFRSFGLLSGVGASINFKTPKAMKGFYNVDTLGQPANQYPDPDTVGMTSIAQKKAMMAVSANGY